MKKFLAIAALSFCVLEVSLMSGTSFLVSSIAQVTRQVRNWGLTYGPYDRRRTDYAAAPLQVLILSGGKLGPKEKFRIFISRVKNETDKRVVGAKFSWLLFDHSNLNQSLQTAETDLISLDLDGHKQTDVQIDVINVEDIQFLQEKNPIGVFHVEVVASEVRYDDGSVWVAGTLPGQIVIDH